MNETRKAAGIIFFMSFLTFLSRILGFGREVVLAKYFGLSDMRGAFVVAFKIPNLVRTLLTDTAISAAFIPVFTDFLVKGKREEAYRLSSSVINISIIILSFIVIICSAFMPYVIAICAPGFQEDSLLFNQTVNLSIIIFPTVIFFAISGVLVGMLNAYKHFTAPSIGPLLWNIIIIIVVLFFNRSIGIYSAAWGILAGTFVQFIILIKPLKDLGVSYSFGFDFKNPAVIRIFKLMIPVTLSLGIINFNVFVDTIFASFLGPRSVAAIDSAFRIFHLPMGIFAVAIGTALFPVLARLSSEMDNNKFRETLESGIGQIFYLTVPCACLFVYFSEPITGIVFERGNFTGADTLFVSKALWCFSLGLPFSSANTLLNRGFYSLKKNWTPLYVGIINITLNAVLDWFLMKKLGHAGICLSTSIVSMFNFFALLILIRNHSEISFLPVIKSFIKILSLSIFAVVASDFVYNFTFGFIKTDKSYLFPFTISFIISICIYLSMSISIGIRESEIVSELYGKFFKKITKTL